MSREHCPDLHARCRSPKVWNHIRNSECVTLNPLFFFRFKDRNWSVAAQTAQTKNKHRKAKEAQKKDPKDPTEHSKDSTLKNIFSRIEIKTGGPLNFGPSNILYIIYLYQCSVSAGILQHTDVHVHKLHVYKVYSIEWDRMFGQYLIWKDSTTHIL